MPYYDIEDDGLSITTSIDNPYHTWVEFDDIDIETGETVRRRWVVWGSSLIDGAFDQEETAVNCKDGTPVPLFIACRAVGLATKHYYLNQMKEEIAKLEA